MYCRCIVKNTHTNLAFVSVLKKHDRTTTSIDNTLYILYCAYTQYKGDSVTTEVVSKILRKIITKIETDQEKISAIFKASGSPVVSHPEDKDKNGETRKETT